jgi:hypothetical protein
MPNVEHTAKNVTATQDAVSRANAELASMLDAARISTVNPHDLSEAKMAVELAHIAADEASRNHKAATDAARLAANDARLDDVHPQLRERLSDIEQRVLEFREAADALWAATQREVTQYSYVVGDLTSTIEPGSTDRFSSGPGGVRVDGRLIKHHKSEVGAEVARSVANLLGLASPGVGSSVRQLGSVMNGLGLPPSTTSKAA